MKSSTKFKLLCFGVCTVAAVGLGIYLSQTESTPSSVKTALAETTVSEAKQETSEEAIEIETTESEQLAVSEEETEPETESEMESETETDTEDIAVQEPNTTAAGENIPATSFTVCIDPGHYKGASGLQGENIYGYEEGVFTLKIALALRNELEQYGIHSYLTRETDSINISGYSNGDLDHGKISLRGEMAKGADLFVSIHTNANQENANGYPTCSQPVGINKTIVLVNQVAAKSEPMIQMANEIGQALTAAGHTLGICETDQFQSADTAHLTEWTDQYNDSLQTQGTVCYRLGQHGDYYGVLRGAANVGVPGMIIEHGFHTVEEVRRQAMQGDLAQEWAKADAYGIAKGFGIIR